MYAEAWLIGHAPWAELKHMLNISKGGSAGSGMGLAAAGTLPLRVLVEMTARAVDHFVALVCG